MSLSWDNGIDEHVWNIAESWGVDDIPSAHNDHNLQLLVEVLCDHSQSDLIQALESVGVENAADIVDEILFPRNCHA